MIYLNIVPIETEDLNLGEFNMIKGINESKTLTKHISCECKCKYDMTEQIVIQINDGIMINANVSVKKLMYLKKIMLGILLHVILKMENF